MKQGYIVLLNFPFSNRIGVKVRPALVISNAKFNKGDDIIVLGVSSQDGINSVKLCHNDISKGELKKDSYVKVGAVLAMEKSLTIKSVARVSTKKLSEVIDKFHKLTSM